MMARDNLYAELMEDLHPNRPRVEILGDSRVQPVARAVSCCSRATRRLST